MTTTLLSCISGTAFTNLSKHSASFLFSSANSFKILRTSVLSISLISDSDPMVSQSDCSSLSFTQYRIIVDSSDGTITEITTYSGSAPGSDLIVRWPPSCFKCFPPSNPSPGLPNTALTSSLPIDPNLSPITLAIKSSIKL